jgi:AcrR family transcriptional regulator
MKTGSQRRKTSANGQGGRERILDAARALFAERGYAGLSISAICERASIAPTSIYWHFGDKAGLLRAVIEETSRHAEPIRRAAMSREVDFDERIDLVVKRVRKLAIERPLGSLSFVALLSGGESVSGELRSALVAARERELATLTRDCDAIVGASAGRSVALMVLAFANYAALTHRVTRRRRDVDEILAALRQQLRAQRAE